MTVRSEARRPRFRAVGTFGLVGIASTSVYLALTMALGHAGVAAGTASLAAYGAVMIASYAGHRWITFRSSRPHREAVPRFVIVNLLGLAVSLVAPLLLTQRLGVLLPVSALVVALLVPAISFVGNFRIVFRTPASE